MQVLYGDGGSPGVVKPVWALHLEHEHGGAVEKDQENKDRDHTHQRHMAEVALAVVGGGEISVREFASYLSL